MVDKAVAEKRTNLKGRCQMNSGMGVFSGQDQILDMNAVSEAVYLRRADTDDESHLVERG